MKTRFNLSKSALLFATFVISAFSGCSKAPDEVLPIEDLMPQAVYMIPSTPLTKEEKDVVARQKRELEEYLEETNEPASLSHP